MYMSVEVWQSRGERLTEGAATGSADSDTVLGDGGLSSGGVGHVEGPVAAGVSSVGVTGSVATNAPGDESGLGVEETRVGSVRVGASGSSTSVGLGLRDASLAGALLLSLLGSATSEGGGGLDLGAGNVVGAAGDEGAGCGRCNRSASYY